MPLLLALLFCFVYVVMDNVATSPASSGYTQSAGLKGSAAEGTAQTLRAYHAAAIAWLEKPAQASFVGTVPKTIVEQALAQQSIQPGSYTTFRAADGLTTTWLALGAGERVKNARVGDIAAALVRADGEARTAGTVLAGSFRPGNGINAITLDPQIAPAIRDGMPMLASVINVPSPILTPASMSTSRSTAALLSNSVSSARLQSTASTRTAPPPRSSPPPPSTAARTQ